MENGKSSDTKAFDYTALQLYAEIELVEKLALDAVDSVRLNLRNVIFLREVLRPYVPAITHELNRSIDFMKLVGAIVDMLRKHEQVGKAQAEQYDALVKVNQANLEEIKNLKSINTILQDIVDANVERTAKGYSPSNDKIGPGTASAGESKPEIGAPLIPRESVEGVQLDPLVKANLDQYMGRPVDHTGKMPHWHQHTTPPFSPYICYDHPCEKSKL